MRVASTRAPNDWHEVSAVLSVMDVGVERQAFRNPADIARVLRPHMAEMEEAFSGDRHSEVERRLSDIYAHDGAVTRQWETEINRRLYPDR